MAAAVLVECPKSLSCYIYFNSNANSFLSGLTSAFGPEIFALPYLFNARSLARLFSKSLTVTRCSPATAPSPGLSVVSSKVPSDFSDQQHE
jgi:hypothetical protein